MDLIELLLLHLATLWAHYYVWILKTFALTIGKHLKIKISLSIKSLRDLWIIEEKTLGLSLFILISKMKISE